MKHEQLYLDGLGRSLDELIDVSVRTVKHYLPIALEMNPEGYYGCFSGGKDSIAVKWICEQANVPVRWNYSVTTIDPPELVRFIRDCHPDVMWERHSKHTLLTMVITKGLPTRRMRWCCAEFKETGGEGYVKITGIRSAESPRRAAQWKVMTQWRRKDKVGWVLNPIITWSDEHVWSLIKRESIPYCSLYDEGFKRLGCVGCPMSYRRAKELARWPGYEKLWRRAARLHWDRRLAAHAVGGQLPRHIRTFENADQWFDWWLSNKSMPWETDDENEDECLGLVW